MEPMQAPASWSGCVPNTFDPHNEVTERICDLGLYNENEQRFDLDFDQPIYREFLRPEEKHKSLLMKWLLKWTIQYLAYQVSFYLKSKINPKMI